MEPVRVPPWLLRVREQIEGTCAQGLSVGALAETADVHPVYLVTAFKRAFHSTPGEFQRLVRIDCLDVEIIAFDLYFHIIYVHILSINS